MSGPLSDIHAPSVMSGGDQPKSAQLDALQLYAKRDGSKGVLYFAPHLAWLLMRWYSGCEVQGCWERADYEAELL